MKYFKEVILLKELGQEGKLTEQEVLAGIDRFDPTLGSFHDKQGAMRWLESQKIIGKKEGDAISEVVDEHTDEPVPASPSISLQKDKLDWLVSVDDVYYFNSQQAATLLNQGAITPEQYKYALEKLKGYLYAFCWDGLSSLKRWIDSGYQDASIYHIDEDDEDFLAIDLNRINPQTALQLFALYKNKVISEDEYFDGYEVFTSHEDTPLIFQSAIECFEWLAKEEYLYHSFKSFQAAIHYTHNASLLNKLEEQGVINHYCKTDASDRLDSNRYADYSFTDEQALLLWIKKEGFFAFDDPTKINDDNQSQAIAYFTKAIQLLVVAMLIWSFIKKML